MLPRYETLVEEIREKRKELGWSQSTLAKRAGVSRSLVGKLERMDNIPNYVNVRKIYQAVEEEKKGMTAEDFVTEEIRYVSPKDTIKKAADIMKENDFSQLPVKRDVYMGLVHSNDIGAIDDREKEVGELTLHSLPRVPHDTPKDDFKNMFNTHRAVLVEKNGRVLGMITAADLL